MNRTRSRRFPRLALAASAAVVFCAAAALAQSDLQRETVAITYPVDQGTNVRFRGTTRLPRVSGEAKVTRSGRRGTRVELNVKNLPRAIELGNVYTTFVVWAISPEGRTDNLGEIKRDGSFLANSKVDVTTPLQTFAMIVTAEPHFLVRGPSRMVVLENLPPNKPGDADVATVTVRYAGNASDYFNQSRVPDLADQDYIRTPVPVLGARQSVQLARFAGAERDAPGELQKAADLLAEAENLWRMKAPETEVEAKARQAIDAGVRAEEVAEARRGARQRREEVARRDAAVREAEKSADTLNEEIADMRRALDRSERARELSDRDLANANQQVRDLRSENARLRDEAQRARAESEEVKVRLARLEGERAAQEAQRVAEQRASQQQAQASAFRQSLSRFGALSESQNGVTLTLPDAIWGGARSAELSANAASTLEQLAALLANNPGYSIYVEVYTDNKGDEAALRRLAQDRAAALAARLSGAGVANERIQASGMGPEKPLAPNTTPAGRARNRRTEITVVPAETTAAAPAGRP